MTTVGTPLSPSATRVLFCGGGELQRLGANPIEINL